MRSRGVTTPLIQREVVFVSITEIIFGIEVKPQLTTLDECFVVEMKTGANRFFICVCYRSSSQNLSFSLISGRKPL